MDAKKVKKIRQDFQKIWKNVDTKYLINLYDIYKKTKCKDKDLDEYFEYMYDIFSYEIKRRKKIHDKKVMNNEIIIVEFCIKGRGGEKRENFEFDVNELKDVYIDGGYSFPEIMKEKLEDWRRNKRLFRTSDCIYYSFEVLNKGFDMNNL